MQVESSESQPRTKENDSATGGGCRRPLQREVMQSAYRHLPLVLGLPITPAHLTFPSVEMQFHPSEVAEVISA